MFPLVNTPQGGHIHAVRVPVNLGRNWTEAVDAAGPDTARFDIPIRSRAIGDKYPESGPPRETEVILVNFGNRSVGILSIARWSYRFGLAPQGPREIFAVGEHCPDLPRELGSDTVLVVSSAIIEYNGGKYMPKVEWHGGGRGVGMVQFETMFDHRSWFAFSLNVKS